MTLKYLSKFLYELRIWTPYGNAIKSRHTEAPTTETTT